MLFLFFIADLRTVVVFIALLLVVSAMVVVEVEVVPGEELAVVEVVASEASGVVATG